jgi:membrane-associated phospholipid phosphatase
MNKQLLITLMILANAFVSGQEIYRSAPDSQSFQSIAGSQIVPAAMIAGSVLLHAGNLERKIQDFFPDTDTRADNWLRLMPAAQIYAFDALGLRHRNSVLNQTKNLAASLAASAIVVDVLKKVTAVERPGGGKSSYPSSHTCVAFAGATALYLEFREENPILAYSGFVTAGATGLLRVTNGAHWLPDVLAGAGLGMLITNLVYYADPFRQKAAGGRKTKIAIQSEISGDGLCLRITF